MHLGWGRFRWLRAPATKIYSHINAWPVVYLYHRPSARSHQRHINTQTEKSHSRALARAGVHRRAFGCIAPFATPRVIFHDHLTEGDTVLIVEPLEHSLRGVPLFAMDLPVAASH